MRTRIASAVGQGWASRRACAAIAASSAPRAEGKTANRPSPVLFTVVPPRSATQDRTISSCSLTARPIVSGSCSHRAVDDSMSVKRKAVSATGSTRCSSYSLDNQNSSWISSGSRNTITWPIGVSAIGVNEMDRSRSRCSHASSSERSATLKAT